MVDTPGGMIGMQHQSFDIGRIEMEHAGLAVIDPNDRVIVMGCHDISVLSGCALHRADRSGVRQDAAAGASTTVLVLSTLS